MTPVLFIIVYLALLAEASPYGRLFKTLMVLFPWAILFVKLLEM